MTKIKVAIVEPGSIKTPIWDKGFEKVKDTYANTMFAKPFQRFIEMALKQVDRALPVSAVSECVLHAMTSDHPKIRYTPIPDKFVNWYAPRFLPVRTIDQLTAKILKLS